MSKFFVAGISYSIEKENYWQYNFQFFIKKGFVLFYTIIVWLNMSRRAPLNELVVEMTYVFFCVDCPEDLLQNTVAQAGPKLDKMWKK